MKKVNFLFLFFALFASLSSSASESKVSKKPAQELVIKVSLTEKNKIVFLCNDLIIGEKIIDANKDCDLKIADINGPDQLCFSDFTFTSTCGPYVHWDYVCWSGPGAMIGELLGFEIAVCG
jgi:hypothetical protein